VIPTYRRRCSGSLVLLPTKRRQSAPRSLRSAGTTTGRSAGWSVLREALGQFDRGEVDVFEFDELSRRYQRASKELWLFCSGGGQRLVRIANLIEIAKRDATEPDWWSLAAPRRQHGHPDAPNEQPQ